MSGVGSSDSRLIVRGDDHLWPATVVTRTGNEFILPVYLDELKFCWHIAFAQMMVSPCEVGALVRDKRSFG